MTAAAIATLVALLWGLKELLLGFLVYRQRKRIRHELRVERTRRHFAETRNQLFKLAMQDKVDVNSFTFRGLYTLHTFIMRRTDRYPEISEMLRLSLMAEARLDDSSKNPLSAESSLWTKEVKNVVLGTAQGLGMLIIDYSPSARL